MNGWLILALLIALNIWVMLLFWYDKRRAECGDRRIPESTLLGWAFLGGSPGALIARRLFRHKTRKQPFSTILYVICVAQIGLIVGWNLVPG